MIGQRWSYEEERERTVKLNINPFDSSNPMSFKDAAVVAAVAALAVWILTFLSEASLGEIRVDPEAFIFDAVKTYLVAWAGNFITLAGLSELVKRAEKEGSERG